MDFWHQAQEVSIALELEHRILTHRKLAVFLELQLHQLF